MALIKCPDCGKEISDAAPTCIGCGRPMQIVFKPTNPFQSIAQEEQSLATPISLEETEDCQTSFKKLDNLTKWARWLIYTLISLTVTVIISSGFTYRLLIDLKNGVYLSQPRGYVMSVMAANDTRHLIFLIVFLIVLIAVSITILRWVYQANSNAHRLGASEMRFKPEWAVIWFIIPITNLWKPYQVVKEIWKASSDPVSWKDRPAPMLIKWWWFSFIMCTAFNALTSKAINGAKTLDELLVSNIAGLISNILIIPFLLFFAAIVTRICEMQTYAYCSALSGSLVSSLVEQQKDEVKSFKYLAAFFIPIVIALLLVGFMTYQSGLFQKDIPPEAQRKTQAFPAKEEAKPQGVIFNMDEAHFDKGYPAKEEAKPAPTPEEK